MAAIEHTPDLWLECTDRQNFDGTAHKDTETIFLRWAKDTSLQAAFTEIPAIDMPNMSKIKGAKALIDLVTHSVGAKELGRVIVVKLKPGGMLDKHIDEGQYAEHYERFHLVLHSKADNSFFVESETDCGEFVHMATGELWCFNHHRPHWAFNGSDCDRVHLIIDAVSPKFKWGQA